MPSTWKSAWLDTGEKSHGYQRASEEGSRSPDHLAVKALCTAGSGQGVVTEMANVNQYPAALKRMKRLWARVEPERSLDSRVLML